MDQRSQTCELEVLDPKYKFIQERDTLILKLWGPSAYIFKSYPLKQISELQKVLIDYFPPEILEESVCFHSIMQVNPNHSLLIKKLKIFLDGLKICVPSPQKDHLKICVITKSLASYCNRIKVYVRDAFNGYPYLGVFIYIPIEVEGLQQRIRDTFNYFSSYKSWTLVFPLGWYIDRAIESEFHKIFVHKFVGIYQQQIKQIPKQDPRIFKFLNIKSVEPTFISSSRQWTSQWVVKEESNGLYGLKLVVQGLDFQILKLYSSLEAFFQKIQYCAKGPTYDFDLQGHLQKKSLNPRLKYIYLNPTKYLLIGPPEYYESAAEEIQKQQWTLTSRNYGYLPFEMLSKYFKKVRMLLAERGIAYENMSVSSTQITFISNKASFDAIKSHFYLFMKSNLVYRSQIQFIHQRHQLECLNRYMLPKEPSSCFSFQIQWENNSAILRCAYEHIKEILDQIAGLLEKCRSQMKCIFSIQRTLNPLVKVIDVTEKLQPEAFIEKRLVSRKLSFQTTFQEFTTSSKSYAVVMLPNTDSRQQLEELLQQKCSLFENKKFLFIEKYLEKPKNLKSIFLWNYKDSMKGQGYKSSIDYVRCQQLLKAITQKDQIVLIITRQLYQYDFESFLYLLASISKEMHQICRKVTLILADTLIFNQKSQIVHQTQLFLQKEFSQKVQSYYSINETNMPFISKLPLYKLSYDHDNTKRINCSNLNSAIFYIQKSRVQRNSGLSGDQCGVFLPKQPGLQEEILVDLRQMKAYTIFKQKVTPFSFENKDRIFRLAKAINTFLPHQSFIVLYAKKYQDNALSAMYLYKPKNKNYLQKYVLEIIENDQQFVRHNKEKTFILEQCRDVQKYKLETHKTFAEIMINVLKY